MSSAPRAGLALALLAAAGCSSVGSTLRLAPPANLRIVVMQHDDSELGRDNVDSLQSFSEQLVATLVDLRAATRVTLFNAGDEGNAQKLIELEEADVVIRPSLGGTLAPKYEGTPDWPIATGLWYATWPLSMLISDYATYSYGGDLAVECAFASAGGRPFFTHSVLLEKVNVSFADRTGFFVPSVLMTVILPAFLTPDDSQSLRNALLRRLPKDVGMSLTRHLKSDFESSARDYGAGSIVVRDCRLRGDQLVLDLNVSCRKRPIKAVAVVVNGKPLQRSLLPAASEQSKTGARSATFEVDLTIDTRLESAPTKATIVIRALAEQVFSRTLEVEATD